jgi:hypothetical protein
VKSPTFANQKQIESLKIYQKDIKKHTEASQHANSNLENNNNRVLKRPNLCYMQRIPYSAYGYRNGNKNLRNNNNELLAKKANSNDKLTIEPELHAASQIQFNEYVPKTFKASISTKRNEGYKNPKSHSFWKKPRVGKSRERKKNELKEVMLGSLGRRTSTSDLSKGITQKAVEVRLTEEEQKIYGNRMPDGYKKISLLGKYFIFDDSIEEDAH